MKCFSSNAWHDISVICKFYSLGTVLPTRHISYCCIKSLFVSGARTRFCLLILVGFMEVTLLTRSTFSLLAFMKGQGDGSFKAVSRIQLFPNSYCFDNIFIILRCLLMFLLRPDSHKTFYCRRPNGDSPATLNFLMKHVIPSASDPPGTHRRHGRKFETCSNFFPLRCQRPRKIHMET